MDIPAASILADIVVDGKTIKAIAQPTKQGILYVFDRSTGQPVWPIVERPVPQSDVPGEKTSRTQPIPTKPPAYARNELKVPDDLIDFTPELRARALENLKQYRVTPTVFNPPVAGKEGGLLGAIYMGMGASNWPGASLDPETNIVYAAAGNAGVLNLTVAPPAPGASDIRYVQGIEGRKRSESDGGVDVRSEFAGSLQGLPLLKPPYGIISAIDLNRGEILWQVPRGDTPDNVRNHPQLKGLNIPKTGQNGSVGSVVTKTLLVLGDSQVTSPPGRPRGAMLRAHDKKSGQEIGAVWMPAAQSGSPMTYMADGRQYIVVAVGGGNYSGEYIAFALPRDARPTSQGAAQP
jgi:quinoprotein glucose dehydrogenase